MNIKPIICVIIGLTGDDLEYNDSDKKSKKKKYRKWIDEETDTDIKTVFFYY